MSNHPNRSKRNPSAARNPRPEEIRAAREAAGLTQTEAAELIYSELRTWQNWEASSSDSNARRMHPAFWELWQLKAAALAKTAYPMKPESFDPGPRDEEPPKYR